MSIAELEAHQHEHHKIATKALRSIAKDTGFRYALVRDEFIAGTYEITALFWIRVEEEHGDRFTGVDWCQGCRKFNLHERLHS